MHCQADAQLKTSSQPFICKGSSCPQLNCMDGKEHLQSAFQVGNRMGSLCQKCYRLCPCRSRSLTSRHS